MENIKHLQKLAEVFDTDKIITSDEIEQVLKGILVIMNSFKKDNQTLNKETREAVEILLDKVLTENAKLKETVNRETSDQKEDFANKLNEIKSLISKVQTIKPIDGIDGKDADEEKIVEDVLARIKLPEYEVYSLEEKGEDIVAEINALPTNEDEYKIDFSHIKNAPEFRGGGGSTARNLYQLMDVQLSAPTDNQVLTYDSTTNTWKNENATGGGGTPGGSDTQLQYNNAGVFGGISGATTNGTTVTYTTGNLIAHDVKASQSAGMDILSSSGTVTALFGAGGGANSTFYGGSKFDYATATTVPYFDASKNLISSAVTPTELGYLSGVTSAIQTQLNAKQASDTQLTSLAGLSYTGNSLKIIRVNAGETDFELATVSAGSGDVSKVGTPVNNQVGVWTGDGTIEGDANLTFDTTTDTLTSVNINATTFTGALIGTASGNEVPLTFGDGLTRTLNDVDLDTTLNILKISGLTSNGFVKTSGGDGTLSVDTNTYLTSLSGAVLTDQTVGQTIGSTGARLTKLWATDITVTNAITGSVTGNAGTVTNATLTTALTVNTGTVTLTGNVANSSVLTIGAGAVSVSGSNTGDNAVNSLYSGLVTNATHTGDATGATALTVVAINGTNLAALGTGILKNTTGTGVPSIAVAGDFPTLNQNTTGSAATLTTTRTIWGQNFNGSANVTGDITLGTGNITMTGSIGATGARATKVWTTDMEVTNAIVGSITGNAATVSSANEASDTTCFPLFITASGTQSLATKNNTNLTFNSSTASLGSTIFNAGTGFQIGGAASSGKILKANGTNFVASTETYAAPGTSGNVMTSDGTNWTSAAPAGGGNPGWDFVSYNTSTSGLTLTVSGLQLSTALSYKIVYQFEGDNNNTPIYMRINGITTSTYITAGWRTYKAATLATESRDSNTTSWWVDGGNTYKNGSGQIQMDLVKVGTGGSYGCQVQGKHTSRGNGSSNDYFQNYDWTGIQTSQTDVTSITLFTDSTTNANIRVWVFKAATS